MLHIKKRIACSYDFRHDKQQLLLKLKDANNLQHAWLKPANFFWDISVRFLSWAFWDFCRRHDHFRRFPKKSEVFGRRPKSAEGEVIEKTLIHKIRDREEGIVIYSFYTWFSFLTWVWVNIFLEIVSSKTATTHIFQSGVRNWCAGVSGREIEVFNPQAWDSRLRRESWQVYINENDSTFDNKVSRQSEYLAASSVWDNTCSDINSLLLQCTF